MRSLHDIGLGTRKIKDFIGDLKGDTKRGVPVWGGYKNQTQNHKIQKNIKTKKQKSKNEKIMML